MKEIRIYIADDGTEFRTKDDCVKYESQFNKICINDDVVFFDIDLNKIEKPILAKDWNTLINKCWYIFIKSEKSFKIVQELFADMGYCFNYDTDVDLVSGLWHYGLWHYNTKYGEWENLTYASNKMNEILYKVSNEIKDK